MRFTLEAAFRGHPALAPLLEGGVWSPQGPLAGTAGPGTHLSLMFSSGHQGVGKPWIGTEENLDKSCLVLSLPICNLGEPASQFSPVHGTMKDSASSIIPPLAGRDFGDRRGDGSRHSSVQGQACLPLGSRRKIPGWGSLGRRMCDHAARVVTSGRSVGGGEWTWR